MNMCTIVTYKQAYYYKIGNSVSVCLFGAELPAEMLLETWTKWKCFEAIYQRRKKKLTESIFFKHRVNLLAMLVW